MHQIKRRGVVATQKKEKREQRQQRNYLRVINSDSKAPDTDLLSLIRSFKVIVLKEEGGGRGEGGGTYSAISVDIEIHSPISALLVALYLRNETPANNDTEETGIGERAEAEAASDCWPLFIFFFIEQHMLHWKRPSSMTIIA